MNDKKKPKLEKVACYFNKGSGSAGFEFFRITEANDGDLFVYNKGVLWKLKIPKEAKKRK